MERNFAEHQPTINAVESAGGIPALVPRPEAITEMLRAHEEFVEDRRRQPHDVSHFSYRALFSVLDQLTPAEKHAGWDRINANLAAERGKEK